MSTTRTPPPRTAEQKKMINDAHTDYERRICNAWKNPGATKVAVSDVDAAYDAYDDQIGRAWKGPRAA